jgi:catechol 2,3-dioxygenase-like lactoylglutathione lyase family enzyme
MILGIVHTALIVREYEEAKIFYCEKLGFRLLEDSAHPNEKRWVRLGAPGKLGSEILLSKATNGEQLASVGNQTGGRVLFFMQSDDFDTDYISLRERGVEFAEAPREETYGKVAVFKDLYGNRIDLVQFKSG